MDEPKEYWAQKAEELKKDGKFEEAVKALDKIHEIENEEKQVDYMYKKAIQYYNIGNLEQAKNTIYSDLQAGHKSYEHFFLLGKILYELEKNEEALEALNKASEEHARRYLKSSIKMEQMKNVRKFEDAVKYSKQVVQENNLNSNYWHLKGNVLFKLRKFDESSSCFETALEKNESDINLQYDLAKSEAWRKNKQKTFDILTEISSKEPSIKGKLRTDSEFDIIREEHSFQKIL